MLSGGGPKGSVWISKTNDHMDHLDRIKQAYNKHGTTQKKKLQEMQNIS